MAWELIRLVPHLALVLKALEDNGSPGSIAAACDHLATALRLLPGVVGASGPPFIDSWQRLEEWGAACDAGLRLVPRLVQWEDSWWGLPEVTAALLAAPRQPPSEPLHLAMVLLELISPF